jgi:dihydrofolate reductase
MNLIIIAACDANWGIGYQNGLPWHEPADLKHFRDRTMGKHLIMGRKTHDGLPGILKGRTIHVASRSEGRDGATTIENIIDTGIDLGLDEMLVAGGAEIYRAMEPLCSFAEITRIPGSHLCDTHLVNLAERGWTRFADKSLTHDIIVEYWRKSFL